MGKQNDVGVFQLENGKWAFRYTFTKNGKRSSKRSCKDEFGNSLNTKRAAIKARQIAVDAEALNQPLKPVERKTVAEVFKEYREKGCSGKAYQTIRKQDSLWENHIRDGLNDFLVLFCGKSDCPLIHFLLFPFIFSNSSTQVLIRLFTSSKSKLTVFPSGKKCSLSSAIQATSRKLLHLFNVSWILQNFILRFLLKSSYFVSE